MSQSGPPPPGAGASQPGAGARKPDAPKPPLSKRAYTLKLTFSMLLTTAIVALIGVSWVFMLGVMVGRGDNPDAKVRELTGRMLRGGQAPAVQEPPQAILRPEELNFSVALREKPPHNGTAAMGTPAAQPPTHQTGSAAPIAPARNGTSPLSAQPATLNTPQGAQPVRFDYVYQVAAFREPEQADKLRERLEGEGVRTSMEKSPAKGGKSLYIVLAVRRGTEEDSRQLQAVFERLKLGAPLLRSQKPAPGGAGTR